MEVEVAGAGTAAEILVAAADGEIDIERRDADGEHTERVIDVEQHARAGCMRGVHDRRQLRQHLTGLEEHLRDDDEIGPAADRRADIGRREQPVGARLDERERDAPALRILAQDHVERIEFATGGDDARHAHRSVFSTARSPWPALIFGTTQSALGAPISAASRARHAAISPFHSSHASPSRANHAASPSRTSPSVASRGRPSE